MKYLEIHLDGDSAAYMLDTRGELVEVSEKRDDDSWNWNKPNRAKQTGPLVDPVLLILRLIESA